MRRGNDAEYKASGTGKRCGGIRVRVSDSPGCSSGNARDEEQARREVEPFARLQRQEDELRELRNRNQLSLSIDRANGDLGTSLSGSGEGDIRVGAELKFKLDTFDGTLLLSEFFAQFNLIAHANRWKENTKTVALASCLR